VPNNDTTTLESGEHGAEITVTESLLTGQEGDEPVDSAEAEAAMLAGFNRVSGKRPEANDDTPIDTGKKRGDGEGDDAPLDTQRAQQTAAPPADDPEVPGMGMKASELKAQLARLDALEKSTSSTAGHLGHLKQLVQQAGKGKTITAESLKKVSEEFGAEYAQALAEDLNAAGIGGGASVDEETLSRIVGEQVSAQRESMTKEVEQRLVRARHADAADYFQGGKHNADFAAFIGTLPAPRQAELADTWDSGVINQALDEFKTHKAKVATDQTKQTRRMERGVTPTAARGATVSQPSVDPIEAGWNNVRGRSRGAMGARR
jgi:hypothetical protein